MLFRCPYCGEPTFSAMMKLGIGSRLSPPTAARCHHCHHVCTRLSTTGGAPLYGLLLVALGLLGVGCIAAGAVWQAWGLIPVGVTLVAVLYGLANYFFSYYDKLHARERKEDTVFTMTTTTAERLWPTVRQGEIYVFQFPQEGMRDCDAPQVIGLIDRLRKTADAVQLTVRVIRWQDMTQVPAEAAVVLATEGMLTLSGRVTQTK